NQTVNLPFELNVARVNMGRPRLSLSMWDYTNRAGYEGITPRNRQSAIDSMRSHFVDSPWATKDVLPWPTADEFDAAGRLQAPLRWDALDTWLDTWPGARHYFVFVNANSAFAGAPRDSRAFQARVGSW